MKFPTAKATLTIMVTIIYTVTLTTLFAAMMNSNHDLNVPSFGNIYVLGFDIHDGDILWVNNIPTLNWSTTYVGESTNRSFYAKSKSNIEVRMNLTTANWVFNNSNDQTIDPYAYRVPITVTPNYNGTYEPNQEIFVTLELKIPYDPDFIDYLVANQVRTFSFDITIRPSQV